MSGATGLRFGVFVPQGWKLEYRGWSALDAWERTKELAVLAEQVQAYVDAGCREFVLWFRDAPSSESLERFRSEVVPLVRAP